MPLYTYRRADGTTFEVRQKFLDEPLTVDPDTGQPVVRVVQPAGIIFKGSGFYVNDSKSKSTSTLNSTSHAKDSGDSNGAGSGSGKSDSTSDSKSKSDTKTPSTSAAAD